MKLKCPICGGVYRCTCPDCINTGFISCNVCKAAMVPYISEPEKSEPEKSSEIIRGFRAFHVRQFRQKNGEIQMVLAGATGTFWHKPYFRSICSHNDKHLNAAGYGRHFHARGPNFERARKHLMDEDARIRSHTMGHGCGIYMTHDPEVALEAVSERFQVVLAACIADGGIVEEHTLGYLCEKVRIERLWLHEGDSFGVFGIHPRTFDYRLAQELSVRYKCPVGRTKEVLS